MSSSIRRSPVAPRLSSRSSANPNSMTILGWARLAPLMRVAIRFDTGYRARGVITEVDDVSVTIKQDHLRAPTKYARNHIEIVSLDA